MPELLRLDEPAGRRLLATTILGSGIAFLDGTIANVALPRIGKQFGADLSALQWVVAGYALTLSAFILVGGAIGDRFGRKRGYGWGIAGFAVCSAVVAISPTIGALVGARLLQGAAAALLTPGSLALIQASFVPKDRMRAIGAWTGTLGIATAGGPVVGGWLVDIDWRIAFWLNVPLAAVALWLLRTAPESRNPAVQKPDITAAVLAPVALGPLSWALTSWPNRGATPLTVGALILSACAAAGFVLAERHSQGPMVPLSLFTDRVFSSINAATLVVYAALSGSMFFLALFLQLSAGWSPLQAGAATVPDSVIMFFLASRGGRLAARYGARPLMLIGLVILAAAFGWLARTPDHPAYLVDVFPGVVLIGLGLSALVAPLTGTVLAAAPDTQAGIASGINNAVARTAGLLAVAGLPLAVGLVGSDYRVGHAIADGFRLAMLWCLAGVGVGAVLTWWGLRSQTPNPPSVETDGVRDD